MFKTITTAILLSFLAFPASAAIMSCFDKNNYGDPVEVDPKHVLVIGKVQYEIAPYHFQNGDPYYIIRKGFVENGDLIYARRLNKPRKCWESELLYNGEVSYPSSE